MITSSKALILYSLLMCAAYVVDIFRPAADFLAFSTQITLGFIAYMTKRLHQKKGIYNGKIPIC